MARLLFSGPTSACFELENQTPYYAPRSFTVFVNGSPIGERSTNVFSVFRLTPGMSYDLLIRFENGREETLSFRTAEETCAVDVRTFGAVGDGTADDTAAIQTVIHFLPEGGRLYFPPGKYLTGPLALKSHIHLEFAEDAALLGSPDRSHYPILPGTVPNLDGGDVTHFGAFEGSPMPMYQALITAQYAEDITIIGPGTVDGNAQNGDWWTDYASFPAARPRLFFFNRCKRIQIHGIHACNAASWQFHPYYSEDVAFYDVSVSAPKDSPNTDALDPESCDRVHIIGCRFSVGDDCIAIKSGKIELGRKYNRPADHHTIRNCLMEFGHGAVTLGSEIGAGVRNLSVTQCFFRGTDRGLRIKSRRGRGENCRIDNVSFDNIRMDGVLTPVAVNLWYNCCDEDRHSEYVWTRKALSVDERTPRMGRFAFRHLTCTNAHAAACYIDGLPESPIEEVTFSHVRVSFAPDARAEIPIMKEFAEPVCRLGLYLDNVRRVRVEDVTLENVEGEPLVTNHCGDVSTVRLETSGTE